MDVLDIAVQEQNKNILASAVKNKRIAHSYIFEGQDMQLMQRHALNFAFEIMGTDNPNHPDITVVTNELYDEKSTAQSLKVDTMRQMRNDCFVMPYMSDWKVYIIPNAHTMQEEAGNSILKILEEPPEYCVIILLTTNRNKLLKTIQSRSVLLRFPSFAQDEIPDDSAVAVQRRELITLLKRLSVNSKEAAYDIIAFLKSNKAILKSMYSVMQMWLYDCMRASVGLKPLSFIEADVIKFNNSEKAMDMFLKYIKMLDNNVKEDLLITCMIINIQEVIFS